LYALRRGGGTCEKGGWRGGAGREGEGRFSVSKCCFATVGADAGGGGCCNVM
jgi:hypothetical protein